MSSTASKLPPWPRWGRSCALILACAFLPRRARRFLSAQNFALILQQVMVVAVIAIGQTLVILTAGIDLSCGMVMALGGIVMTKMAADYGLSAPVAIACGMAVTMLFGLVNGLLVTKIKLPPFIVTLGTLNIAFAATQLYSGAQTITDIPAGMVALGNTFQLGQTAIVWGAVLMLVLYLVTWFALRETAPGRHVYAVGNSPGPRASPALPPTRYCWACTCWQACSTALRRCCRWRAPAWATHNAGQTRTSTPSAPVVLGGTSLLAGAASSWARWWGR